MLPVLSVVALSRLWISRRSTQNEIRIVLIEMAQAMIMSVYHNSLVLNNNFD
jgi:hypothetical protein